MIHTCAIGQGQRSVGSKDRLETDRQKDGQRLTWSIINHTKYNIKMFKMIIVRK